MSRMTLVWVGVYGLSAYALFRAVSRRHGVEATLAWMFAILALSVAGALSYLLLSSPGVKQTARQSIWSEYYLIRNDETGHRFLEMLTEKARAGIEVRLLYDAIGSIGLDAARLQALKDAGGRVEAFLPINPLRRRWSVHLRNHRKMIIVDGEVGFTGGMNVGDEYSGRARRKGGQIFHDTHLMVRGPAVGGLAQTFVEDWLFATDERLPPPPAASPSGPDEASIVAVVPSGPDQEHNANALVFFAGIASARDKVYRTSPYFIPDYAVLQALISTAMRGGACGCWCRGGATRRWWARRPARIFRRWFGVGCGCSSICRPCSTPRP